MIQGELSAGFGKAALINTTAAVFNNKEIGEEQGGEDLDPDNPLGLDTSVAPLVDLSNNLTMFNIRQIIQKLVGLIRLLKEIEFGKVLFMILKNIWQLQLMG